MHHISLSLSSKEYERTFQKIEVEQCDHQGPVARGGCKLTLVSPFLYLFGGANRRGVHFNDVWRIDQACSQAWECLTSLISGEAPAARSGHSFNAIACAKIVVFGGMNMSEELILNDCAILHTLDLHWEIPAHKGQPPRPRTEHTGNTLLTNQ